MFDANELRILISGAPGEIDVNDWRNHSQYRGKIQFILRDNKLEYSFVVAPYSKEHPVIQAFWRCVHEFTDDQKRKLLKFTTSCSRPPLFGFKVNIIKSHKSNLT
jgi:ubiquitin-protein ligase E3 C